MLGRARFFPQTQQGADIIATSLKTRVYMPDFFEPNQPFSAEKYPPKSDIDKADLQAFFGGTAKPDVATGKLKDFGLALRQDGAKKIGAYGFCWGMLRISVTI
jgi:dienelactone hydrolase